VSAPTRPEVERERERQARRREVPEMQAFQGTQHFIPSCLRKCTDADIVDIFILPILLGDD
jgi:hypothetical protein